MSEEVGVIGSELIEEELLFEGDHKRWTCCNNTWTNLANFYLPSIKDTGKQAGIESAKRIS